MAMAMKLPGASQGPTEIKSTAPNFYTWADQQIAAASGGAAGSWADLESAFKPPDATDPLNAGKEWKNPAFSIKEDLIKQYTDVELKKHFPDPKAYNIVKAQAEAALGPELLKSKFAPLQSASAAPEADPLAAAQDSTARLAKAATDPTAKAQATIRLEEITRMNGEKLLRTLKIDNAPDGVKHAVIDEQLAIREKAAVDVIQRYQRGELAPADAQKHVDSIARDIENLEGARRSVSDRNDAVVSLARLGKGILEGAPLILEQVARVSSGAVSTISGEGFVKGYAQSAFGNHLSRGVGIMDDIAKPFTDDAADANELAYQAFEQATDEGGWSAGAALATSYPGTISYGMVKGTMPEMFGTMASGGAVGKAVGMVGTGLKMAATGSGFAESAAVAAARANASALSTNAAKAAEAAKAAAGAGAGAAKVAAANAAKAAETATAKLNRLLNPAAGRGAVAATPTTTVSSGSADMRKDLESRFSAMSADKFLSLPDVQAESSVWMQLKGADLDKYIAAKKRDIIDTAFTQASAVLAAEQTAAALVGARFGADKFLLGGTHAFAGKKAVHVVASGVAGGTLEGIDEVGENAIQHYVVTDAIGGDWSTPTAYDNVAGNFMSGFVVGGPMDAAGGMMTYEAPEAAKPDDKSGEPKPNEPGAPPAGPAPVSAKTEGDIPPLFSHKVYEDGRPVWKPGLDARYGAKFTDDQLRTPAVSGAVNKAWAVFHNQDDPWSIPNLFTNKAGRMNSAQHQEFTDALRTVYDIASQNPEESSDPMVVMRARHEVMRYTNFAVNKLKPYTDGAKDIRSNVGGWIGGVRRVYDHGASAGPQQGNLALSSPTQPLALPAPEPVELPSGPLALSGPPQPLSLPSADNFYMQNRRPDVAASADPAATYDPMRERPEPNANVMERASVQMPSFSTVLASAPQPAPQAPPPPEPVDVDVQSKSAAAASIGLLVSVASQTVASHVTPSGLGAQITVDDSGHHALVMSNHDTESGAVNAERTNVDVVVGGMRDMALESGSLTSWYNAATNMLMNQLRQKDTGLATKSMNMVRYAVTREILNSLPDNYLSDPDVSAQEMKVRHGQVAHVGRVNAVAFARSAGSGSKAATDFVVGRRMEPVKSWSPELKAALERTRVAYFAHVAALRDVGMLNQAEAIVGVDDAPSAPAPSPEALASAASFDAALRGALSAVEAATDIANHEPLDAIALKEIVDAEQAAKVVAHSDFVKRAKALMSKAKKGKATEADVAAMKAEYEAQYADDVVALSANRDAAFARDGHLKDEWSQATPEVLTARKRTSEARKLITSADLAVAKRGDSPAADDITLPTSITDLLARVNTANAAPDEQYRVEGTQHSARIIAYVNARTATYDSDYAATKQLFADIKAVGWAEAVGSRLDSASAALAAQVDYVTATVFGQPNTVVPATEGSLARDFNATGRGLFVSTRSDKVSTQVHAAIGRNRAKLYPVEAVSRTILHEQIHRATAQAYDWGTNVQKTLEGNPDAYLSDADVVALTFVDAMDDVFARTKAELARAGIEGGKASGYGFTNPKEFIAELSRPEWVDLLNNIHIGGNSVLSRVMQYIAELFGAKPGSSLSATMRAMDDLWNTGASWGVGKGLTGPYSGAASLQFDMANAMLSGLGSAEMDAFVADTLFDQPVSSDMLKTLDEKVRSDC